MTVLTAPTAGAQENADRARAWLATIGPMDLGREAWAYTSLDDIGARLASVEAADAHPVDLGVVDDAAGRHGSLRIVLVNGVLVPGSVDAGASPRGVRLGTKDDAVHLEIDADTAVDSPVHVVHVTSPEGLRGLSTSRLEVDIGTGSHLRLIESFVGLPGVGPPGAGSAGGAVTGAFTSIHVGDEAGLDHHRIQDERDDAVHVGSIRIEQAAGSRVRGHSVSRGASIGRLSYDVVLGGGGASCDLSGLDAPTGSQRHDTLVTMDHIASDCSSAQNFRGIVSDRARGSFSGHVIVRPATVGTDAHQSNRNLLLAPTAQADSRPWLEIFADDVRCDHGSATGRLDEDALFYLRSRGIPMTRARGLLVEAFAREITAQITPVSLRERVERLLDLEGN